VADAAAQSTGPGFDLVLTTADGVRLAATLFEPAHANGVSVQVNAASATPRQYYRHFAAYLAARGFTVLTYDYRGIGGSRAPEPDADDQSILASGEFDQTAAADFLLRRHPDRALTLVAHSVGGQIAGLTPRAGAWRAVFLMGSAHGYWRLWPNFRWRWTAWFKFKFVLPLLLLRYRRIPRGFSGFEMPRSYAREMRRFCLSPHWLCDGQGRKLRPHNAEIRAPLWLLSLEDDEVVPESGLLDLEDFFPNVVRRHDHRLPSHYGMEKVGHFGFFRRSMPEAAWEEVAQWLLQARR
jgi:predicted alpha/beta hydrolase